MLVMMVVLFRLLTNNRPNTHISLCTSFQKASTHWSSSLIGAKMSEQWLMHNKCASCYRLQTLLISTNDHSIILSAWVFSSTTPPPTSGKSIFIKTNNIWISTVFFEHSLQIQWFLWMMWTVQKKFVAEHFFGSIFNELNILIGKLK